MGLIIYVQNIVITTTVGVYEKKIVSLYFQDNYLELYKLTGLQFLDL